MAAYYKKKSKEELEKIINESKTFAEVMRKLGYSNNRGNSIKGMKEYFDSLGIDYSKYLNNFYAHSHPRNNIEDILVENSTYENIARLKIRLVNEGKMEYRCAICNNKGIWNNKPLVLTLDHINGKHLDHRLENLRFLCPNCHAQTETFAGKNVKH